MKIDDIFTLNADDAISSLQDDKFYKYKLDEGYFDKWLIFKKVKNKVIGCYAWNDNGNLSFINPLTDETKIKYMVFDFSSIEFDTINKYYDRMQDKYKEFMLPYSINIPANDFIVYSSDILPSEITLEDMREELKKRYFPIEVKEINSLKIYKRGSNIKDVNKELIDLINENPYLLQHQLWKTEKKISPYNEHSLFIGDKLEDYKNDNLNKNDLIYYSAFKSIYHYNKNATDNEVMTIADKCYDAWVYDGNGYDIAKFVDFISENYFKGIITLKDIRNADDADIVVDTIDNCLLNIKPDALDYDDEEMERM